MARWAGMARTPAAQETSMGVGTSKRVDALGGGERMARSVCVRVSPQARAQRWDRWARLLIRRGRPRWGLWMSRRATALDGRNCRLWRQRAAAAMRAGALEEGATCYRALLRLEPDNPRAYWRLAMMYELLGAGGAALEVCRQGLRRLPQAGCLRWQHAHLLLNSGSVQEVLTGFEQVAALHPSRCDTQRYLTMALRQAGRVDEVRRCLRKALARRPDDPNLYFALGLCSKTAEMQESVGLLLEGLAAEAACGGPHLDRVEDSAARGQQRLPIAEAVHAGAGWPPGNGSAPV